VEDFVNGAEDLEQKIIRTPLDPRQTFSDDPLRVLRAIRFASRLGFTLDAKIIEAARSTEVRNALLHKVSRERVGIEVDKMMKHPSAAISVEQILSLDLAEETFQVSALSKTDWKKDGLRTLEALMSKNSTPSSSSRYAAVFISLADETYLEKKKSKSVIYGILREHLKIACVDSELSAAISKAAIDLSTDKIRQNSRVAEILLTVGAHYEEALVIAEGYYGLDYTMFREWLASSGLIGCWEWKPHLDGKQLMDLGIPKGKEIGAWTKRQLEWRYEDSQISLDEVRRRIVCEVEGG